MLFKQPTRLFLPTLMVSVLLLCLSGVTGWYLHHSELEASRLLTRNDTRVRAAEELMLIGARKQLALDQFLLLGDPENLEPLPQLRHDAEIWITRADELASTESDRALVRKLRSGHEHFGTILDDMIRQPPLPEGRLEAVTKLNSHLERDVLEPARNYLHFHREHLAELMARNQTRSDQMGFVLLLLGASGALAGALTGVAVARAVQRHLFESQKAMTRSEQLATLGRLAAALAHELRNPLTSMHIITQSAEKTDQLVSLEVTDFSILEHEIERLDESIQTFLDYARPPRPEKRPCIMQSLIQQTVSLVERRAAQTGVKFQVELPNEPVEIEADPGQIKQVLLNIVLNALDASPAGGVVTLRSQSDLNGDTSTTNANGLEIVEIEIIDEGGGLPKSLGNQIFDAFVSTKETGTGLGLAICKRIIEEHHGEIFARNAADRGAIITVRLPRMQPVSIQQSIGGTATVEQSE